MCNELKNQDSHENHPSISNMVRQSINSNRSDIASQDIQSISQVSRLLFTLKAPMKTITTQTWQNSKIDKHMHMRIKRSLKVVMGQRTRQREVWDKWLKPYMNIGVMGNKWKLSKSSKPKPSNINKINQGFNPNQVLKTRPHLFSITSFFSFFFQFFLIVRICSS